MSTLSSQLKSYWKATMAVSFTKHPMIIIAPITFDLLPILWSSLLCYEMLVIMLHMNCTNGRLLLRWYLANATECILVYISPLWLNALVFFCSSFFFVLMFLLASSNHAFDVIVNYITKLNTKLYRDRCTKMIIILFNTKQWRTQR